MAKNPEPNPFFQMFEQFGRDLKLPTVDVEAMLDHHRRNLEALQKAASASASGAGTLMERQKAMLEAALADVTAMAEKLRTPGTPQEMMARQTEFARKGFDAVLKNADEAAAIVRQSGEEAIEILRKRIQESVEELRESFEKRK